MIMKNFKAVLTPEQFSHLLSSLTNNAKDVVIKKHVIEEEDVNNELEELLAALVEGFKEEEEPCQCEDCKREACKCEGVQWPNYEANYKIPTDEIYKFDMDAFKKLSDEDIDKIGKATQCIDHVDCSNGEDYNLADVIDDRDLFDLLAEFHLKLMDKYPKKPKTAAKLAAKHVIALMSEYLKIDE
jgi:hypothetical protein